MKQLKNDLLVFVQEMLGSDNSGHNVDHALRVYNNSLMLLKTEKGNQKVVLTSSLLHDTMDHKLFANLTLQEEKVKTILKKLNYSNEEIEQIIYICQNISFNNGQYKELSTLEAKIVRDADRLDALGSLGIIRTIEYGNDKKRAFYTSDNIAKLDHKYEFVKSTSTTLSHFYDKLFKLENLMETKTGRIEAIKRTKIMHEFIDEFYEEIAYGEEEND